MALRPPQTCQVSQSLRVRHPQGIGCIIVPITYSVDIDVIFSGLAGDIDVIRRLPIAEFGFAGSRLIEQQ